MAQLLMAPSGVRARRSLLIASSLLVVVVGFGCSSRRSSMRPVYLAPAPVVVPAPTSSVVVPATPMVVPSSPVTVPSGVESYGPATEVPAAAPSAPPELTRPGVPSADPGDEPYLKPIDPDSSKVPEKPTSATKPTTGTTTTPSPSARLDGGSRYSASATRPTSVRARVQPYVKDADDLFNPPKADRPWKYIVLHHSATETGGYDSIDHEHRKRLGWVGCGYHFVIGNGTESEDGAIEVSQRWRDQKLGVHCRDGKNPDINEYGIGICLVGDLEKNLPTPRQIAAAKALVTYLEARYKIPVEHSETHAHLAASPTTCPGRLFPTEAILGSSGLANR